MEKLEGCFLPGAGSGQYRGKERAEVNITVWKSHREAFYIRALKYTYYTPPHKYISIYSSTCSHTDYYIRDIDIYSHIYHIYDNPNALLRKPRSKQGKIPFELLLKGVYKTSKTTWLPPNTW